MGQARFLVVSAYWLDAADADEAIARVVASLPSKSKGTFGATVCFSEDHPQIDAITRSLGKFDLNDVRRHIAETGGS